MLSVNCPKTKFIIEKLNDKKVEEIHFKVIRIQGMSILISHNSDDNTAKAVVKKLMKETPELKYLVTSVQIVDDDGKLI